MLSLVLALALQVVPQKPTEMEFNIIQEQWVIDQSVPTRMSKVFSKADTHLILRLGCMYDCREEAEEILRGRGMGAFRLLVWGSRFKDKEIADRCTQMIIDLVKEPVAEVSPEFQDID